MVIATNGEELKEGMPVLVRDRNKECWRYNIFSYYAEGEYYPYVCIDRAYNKCIPYDTNKELVNTNKMYNFNSEFKFGHKVKAKKDGISIIGFLSQYDEKNKNGHFYCVVYQPNKTSTKSISEWFDEIEYIED